MIKGIQILRAFAAIGVVLAHYKLFNIKSGGFGVDIFFIISGFIIAYVVDFSTKDFLKKRIARVVPLYTLATILTAFLAIVKPSWFRNVIVNSEALFKSLFYIPYRMENSGPILSLGWTLNNEMFFYLVMALCILFVKNKKYLSLACGVLILIFFIGFNTFQSDQYIFTFFAKGLLPEFVFGIILYYLWLYYKDRQTKNINVLIHFVGLVSLIFMIYVDVTGEFKVISRNLWRGIPSFFLTFSFLMLEKYFKKDTILNKFLNSLGSASYVMYLFHPYIIFGLKRIVYPVVFKDNTTLLVEIIKFIIMLIVLCVVSIFLYNYVDKPMSKYARKLLKS